MKMRVDAILTADWHLMERNPVCRKDDYCHTQLEKVIQIYRLSREYGCPVLVAGDLFDRWKPSPYLLRQAINVTSGIKIFAIPGNHDLPQHVLELVDKSGIGVLDASFDFNVMVNPKSFVREASRPFVVHPFPFGTLPDENYAKNVLKQDVVNVALLHKFTYAPGDKPVFADTTQSATRLLKACKGFDLVVVGDNHQSFVVERRGQVLVNPGSIGRLTADQESHVPKVYLWNAEENKVISCPLKCSDDVISREHIEKEEERDERIDKFVSTLSVDENAMNIDFEENLRMFFRQNEEVDEDIKNATWECVNE
jgi:DNA repair exonuclease SbcCD nuclease subunit